MPQDNRPTPPTNVRLADLKDTKQRAQFVSDFGYDSYATLVSNDVKDRSAKAKAAREAAMAQKRSR